MNSASSDRFATLFAQEGSKRICVVVAFVIALGLLLSFYGVVTAIGKRAVEQKAQATQQALVFWRCIELSQAEERRACHDRNAASVDRLAAAPPARNATQLARLRN